MNGRFRGAAAAAVTAGRPDCGHQRRGQLRAPQRGRFLSLPPRRGQRPEHHGGAPGINLLNGAVSVNGGRFSGNATAIESTFDTTLRVSGATFTDNAGPDGEAIYGTGSVNMTDSTFTRNSAQLGGAVFLQFGRQEITRCQFSGNTATDAGGRPV